MATYTLSHEVWLAKEVERARGILLVHMEDGRGYTLEELLTLCADYGLHYTNPEYQEIGQQLIMAGFLEVAH